MASKKAILSGSLALAVAAYLGATWYVGQRVKADYAQAVVKVRELLGERAIVVDEFQQGFFSSQAKLALQWPSTESVPDGLEDVRLTVDSELRHGPLAGGRLALAVVQSRFSLQGLRDRDARVTAKAAGPALAAVWPLTGGTDIRLSLPAGELGDTESTLRWHELVIDAAFSSDYKHAKGTWRWPELGMSVAPDHGQDDRAAPRQAPSEPAARSTVALNGLEGEFARTAIDGLWLGGAGTGAMRMARGVVSGAAVAGGDVRVLMDLKNLVGNMVVIADGSTLGVTTTVQATGAIGTMEFESIGYEQKLQRIDIEALNKFQRAVVAQFQGKTFEEATLALQEQGLHAPVLNALMQNAPRLVAALPTYSMKLQATFQGQTGHIEYGAEVQSAPSAAEVEKIGWGPALFMTSVLHASAQLPKSSLAPLFKAAGQAELPEAQLNTMIGAAQASGYLVQEGDQLISKLKVQAGQPMLNGKPFALPMNLLKR